MYWKGRRLLAGIRSGYPVEAILPGTPGQNKASGFNGFSKTKKLHMKSADHYLEKYIILHYAVKSMREAQQTYFADRTSGNLMNAKALERAVDALLKKDVEAPEPQQSRQSNLFNA